MASGWVRHIYWPTVAHKITRRRHVRPRKGLIYWIPLLAIGHVGHMLRGGHPPEATPRLWHCKRVPIRAGLRLRLRLMLVLRLRLRLGR